MVRVGVQLPREFDDAAEYLADARALEAAGADSLWIDRASPPSHDPWMLAAAIAAVTGRVRLAVEVQPAAAPPSPVLTQRLETLHRLSRGRTILKIAAPTPTQPIRPDQLVAAAREAASFPVMLEVAGEIGDGSAARLVDGFVYRGGTAPEMIERARAARRRTLDLGEGGEREQRGEAPVEFWIHVDAPDSREAWRQALGMCHEAGATGVIVPFGSRLLDLLRRPDEEDDRSDLLVAQG
jgi:alkanesulfonate monooxygenase SsuD/methylene tetrahydromethanopterin reductase-like flavin-dependent oxidoreductase (luciferase family)